MSNRYMDVTLDIFERRSGSGSGGFQFVIPGVMMGSKDVNVTFESREWVLTYQDGEYTYEGRAENLTGAYLALIGSRLGLKVTVKEGEL